MKTVKMVNPDTGKIADIHPDEVKNMELAGWKKKVQKAAPKKAVKDAD